MAGWEPHEQVGVELAGYVAFDDYVWRYHGFKRERAEGGFAELAF